MKINNFSAAAVLLLGGMVSASVFAQPAVTVGSEVGVPGQTVTIPVSFDPGEDDIAAFNITVTVSDPTQFDGFSPFAWDGDTALNCPIVVGTIQISCSQPEPNEFRYVVEDIASNPMPAIDFGRVDFEIADGATIGEVVDLTITTESYSDPVATPVTPGASQGGEIEIIDVPPEELSELTVTPDPLDFGTVDLGNMPQQLVITAENTGGSASSLTISAAAYNGDPEFSTVANACDGATLGAGDTCSVTVEFNAGADGDFTGTVDFSSNADNNPNPSVSVLGSADSVAALSINPPSGNVNLGSGLQGDVLSANAVISNNGSADGTFDCTLTDPSGVFSASPLDGGVSAGGTASVALSCSLPTDAEDGDSYAATFSCTGSEGFSSEHSLSCSVSEWEPLPVPTMQKWSLILFALMMLIAGGIGIRFFRT
jgi:hypothetical protein